MKTKQIHIQPKYSGKTTKIIKMFICDWERGKDSIIIVPNMEMKRNIFKEISKHITYPLSSAINDRIYTPDKLKPSNFVGSFIDNVYIDEALFCDKLKLWKAYTSIFYYCNVIAYSTSDRLYSEEKIELTKMLKKNPSMKKYIDSFVLEEIYTHYWENIITEDFEIITPYNREITEEQFRTEYMGEFYEY